MASVSATTTATSVRRLRLSWSLPRIAFYLLVAAGLVSSVRAAVAPARPPALRLPAIPHVDLEAQGYAERFARTYLSYDADRPDAYTRALGEFISNPASSGLQLPNSGRQTVVATRVVDERPSGLGGEVYTVAADTSSSGLLYLAVPVARSSTGVLTISGYPALVGPPPASAVDVSSQLQALQDVSDPQLQAVLRRALSNFLSGHSSDLQADLAPGATVTVSLASLSLQDVQSVKQGDRPSPVYVTVTAQDKAGATYTLTYQVGVVRSAGRPYVTSIENSPTG